MQAATEDDKALQAENARTAQQLLTMETQLANLRGAIAQQEQVLQLSDLQISAALQCLRAVAGSDQVCVCLVKAVVV